LAWVAWRAGIAVEQRELVGQQVEDRRVGIGGLEQARHRVAGAGARVDRRAVLAQARERR
jgi:hypothetical protein